MNTHSPKSYQAYADKQSWTKPTLTSMNLGDAEATKAGGFGEALGTGPKRLGSTS
jgi:hypothetical protein